MLVGIGFGLMAVFFMAGLYVAGALGALALVMMHFFSDASLWNIMSNRAWSTHTEFILVTIPLFILMGELVLRSGIAERMYEAFNRWMIFLPGGLIHTNIASCAVFAACSGHSVATAATIGRVSLPAFRARGYDERLVLGSLAAGGTLGILIPPSIAMVLYALTAGGSIGRLFLAGFIPGFLLAGVFVLVIVIISLIWKDTAPRERVPSLFDVQGWRDRIAAIVPMVPIFLLIFAVLGSIYLGLATPTEAAAFGVTGSLILGFMNNSPPVAQAVFLRALNNSGATLLLPKDLRARLQAMHRGRTLEPYQVREAVRVNMKVLREAFQATARTTAMIFLILMTAFTVQFAFAYLRISTEMASWITGFELSQLELIILLIVFYLLLGTFMEEFTMMLTTLPILLPTLIAAQIDLLWFGIIMVLLIQVAQISPPQGLTLYVIHGARQDVDAETPATQLRRRGSGTINDIYVGVLPFAVCMLVVIGLLIAFPEIALWLPDQVKGPR